MPSLPKTRKANPETEAAIDPSDLASDLGTHARALRAISTTSDENFTASRKRMDALDEELDILWWVFGERDDAGRSWSELPPMDRAVGAARELAARTRGFPQPPSAPALLHRVLGKVATHDTVVSDLAKSIAPVDLYAQGQHSLLPLLTAAAMYREFGAEDDDSTWQTATHRKWGFSTSVETTLGGAAEQLYREIQLAPRLTP